MNADAAKAGDWVQVYGQVTDEDRIHPEDVCVEFYSHNANFTAHVERKRVTVVDPPEGLSYRCRHLGRTGKSTLIRCEKHDSHGKKDHEAFDNKGQRYVWASDATVGYVEDA